MEEITEGQFYKALDEVEKNKPEPIEEPDEVLDPWLENDDDTEEIEEIKEQKVESNNNQITIKI
jgi:hypothetical protein